MENTKKVTHNYTEDKIITLESLKHIRERPGMYIGRLGDGKDYNDGIYILFKEIVDNSIDEFIMGFGDKIEITCIKNKITVRDYGRGIPLGKIEDCVSVINTGGKFNNEVFQFSVGMNGVGTKAVNALSSSFIVTSNRDGKFRTVSFKEGVITDKKEGKTNEKDGTYIEFIPDEKIFGKYEFNEHFIIERIKKYVYLNSGLKIIYNGKEFYSKNGLKDLLEEEVGDEKLYDIIHIKDDKLEWCFTHTDNNGENYFSFANGQYTSEGGTHQQAFREGILKGINEYSKTTYNSLDVREGIVGAISIKIVNPLFESQIKNKLANQEIRNEIINKVKDQLIIYLNRYPNIAKKIIDKIKENEEERNRYLAIKNAKDKIRKTSINIPKLKDCKIHLTDQSLLREKTTIFITEGQSASGSMVSCRDVMTQAVYSLRGKPLNVFGFKKSRLSENEELYNLSIALGIENEIEGLRYNKIVIATDADHDGFHIRNLILTFFLVFFEELVIKGHIYILETPLFRVRNNKETIYCYTEEEKINAIKKLKNCEITRFKGLGEISPKEFGQFIGENMKLTKVTVEHIVEIKQSLAFYMGNNTQERKEYIMENLI